MFREEIKEISASRGQLRTFGFTMAGVCFGLSVYFYWIDRSWYVDFLVVSVVLSLLGFFRPMLLRQLHTAWMSLAVTLGWVMTRVILGTLFFVVVTPIGFIARRCGKHFLDLELSCERKSYWHERAREDYKKITHEQQF